jgi:hypothetical protein
VKTELQPLAAGEWFRASDRPVVGEIFAHVQNIK